MSVIWEIFWRLMTAWVILYLDCNILWPIWVIHWVFSAIIISYCIPPEWDMTSDTILNAERHLLAWFKMSTTHSGDRHVVPKLQMLGESKILQKIPFSGTRIAIFWWKSRLEYRQNLSRISSIESRKNCRYLSRIEIPIFEIMLPIHNSLLFSP